jgi:cell division protein FtsQ
LKGNFFSLDLEEVRGTLERLPWVRKVELRRVWPAGLEVNIEEHHPVARWGEGRGELVNSFGEVFAATAPADEMAALPMLYGPSGTAPEVLKRYGEFVGSFKVLGQKPVQVTLSPRLAWQAKLENGMVVEMGREQPKAPVALRLQRFIGAYPETVGRRPIRPSVVDLRYPNGFAMRVAGEGKGK